MLASQWEESIHEEKKMKVKKYSEGYCVMKKSEKWMKWWNWNDRSMAIEENVANEMKIMENDVWRKTENNENNNENSEEA